MKRYTLLVAVAVAITLLSGCAESEPGVPVTDEMRQAALELARSGQMPDYSGWEMEETRDGVRYLVLGEGSGRAAWYDDEVRVHHYLWLPDGTPVDSTRPDGIVSPFEFTVGQGRTIAGWDEVIQVMQRDTEVLAVIPWELGYGRQGRGEIPGRTDLVFYIELLSIR